MTRVVLDTNVLVSGAYDDLSASWQIIEACLRGELTAVVSPALCAEYEEIVRKAVRIRGHEEQVQRFLAVAEAVVPQTTPRVVPDDPEDDKVVAAAVAGDAAVILTNDRHLLSLDPYHQGNHRLPIRILKPVTFAAGHAEGRGSAWQDFARFLGIG